MPEDYKKSRDTLLGRAGRSRRNRKRRDSEGDRKEPGKEKKGVLRTILDLFSFEKQSKDMADKLNKRRR